MSRLTRKSGFWCYSFSPMRLRLSGQQKDSEPLVLDTDSDLFLKLAKSMK